MLIFCLPVFPPNKYIHTSENISIFFFFGKHDPSSTFLIKQILIHSSTVSYIFFNRILKWEQVILTNTHGIATLLVVSIRDHGTVKTKSTEVIHNTQYVLQPSFTEEIH